MKKKLLFVINTLGCGGAEKALLALLGRLDEQKYEVHLLVMLGQGELVRELPPHVRLLNKNYSPLSVLTKAGRRHLLCTMLGAFFKRAAGLRLFPYLCRNLFRMCKKHRVMPDKLLWRMLAESRGNLKETYDLAVAWIEGASAFYVADHVMANKKAALVHIDYTAAGYDRQLDGSRYLAYDRIFTVSDEVRECFKKVYPERENKLFILHNLIDQQYIRRYAEEAGGFSDDYEGIRLLTVGRLHYQKAYDIAIDTMALLKQEGVPARWYVLGEGDQRDVLEKKIEKLGLQSDFLLLGVKENPYPYYAQADIYVHCTRFEGKALAIQEAQTLGCAVLASDCSGNREQITDGVDGLLCELNPEGIRDGILRLIEDPELRKRLSEAAGQKPMTEEKELNQLLELI